MRQFEGFTNKLAVPTFTRDNSWHPVTLTGIPDDTQLVTIEVSTPVSGTITNCGTRPTGATNPRFGPYNRQNPAQETLIVRVNGSKQIDIRASSADADFSLTGAWGGLGIKTFGPNGIDAPNWVGDVWREVDLTSYIDEEDLGNVEAVICFLQDGNFASIADVRGVGSSWTAIGMGTNLHCRDSIVRVDENNLVEVWEESDGKGGQASQVTFIGYILKGVYVNHDDGKFYRYKSILNPSDDNVSSPDDFSVYNIGATTVSQQPVGVYWRTRGYYGGHLYHYAREVGSTDAALLAKAGMMPAYPLNLNANGEVEFRAPVGITASLLWAFGYVEEAIKRNRSRIMKK